MDFLERVSGLHGNHIDKHAFYTKIITILAVAIYIFALLDKKTGIIAVKYPIYRLLSAD